ncbi:hypothetical protein Tco_1043346 [Tanacetum coccineum]|uniref:Uncharacterized protein n=1 Tax=Tanacetum coccineum TaxID=301880 RepID=A0ABQ5GLR8_9ASTR
MALVQDGRDKIVISRLLLVNQARKCHVEERKAQGLMKFTLSVLSKEAQSSNHTDARLEIRVSLALIQRPINYSSIIGEIVRPVDLKERGMQANNLEGS